MLGKVAGIRDISIHVPREGHDFQGFFGFGAGKEFLSTCPARGTTTKWAVFVQSAIFLSTCPARGTTVIMKPQRTKHNISIHVPREGHDSGAASANVVFPVFLSTCPARGTTI